MNLNKWLKESNYAHKWVNEEIKNGAQYRWNNKKIIDKKYLWDGKSLKNIKLNGVGELLLLNNMLKINLNDDVEDITPRPNSSIIIDLNEKDYTNFNRVSLMIKPISTGFVNFYMHISFGNNDDRLVHAPSVIPNEWNKIVFELDETKRDNVETINITPFLFGTPPEALPDISFLIKEIKIEKVQEDYVEGWNLDNRIAYSHVGYFINKAKVAIAQNIINKEFVIKNKNNEIVYTNQAIKVVTDEGIYYKIDFTNLNVVGKYYLEIDDKKTEYFEISDNPYALSIWKSIQFLRTLRCGEDVDMVHSACHLNCRTTNLKGYSVPNFGGWHDAGDVSQFEICTAEMAEAIIELANTVRKKDDNLYQRLLEEAKIGVNWILRTSFDDGERAMAVGYNIWRKNILSDQNEAVKKSVSEQGPFENFLACSCLLTASIAYKDDKIYSDWCYRTALKDFETAINCYEKGIYTKRWGSNIDSVVAGIASSCISKLYKITHDEKYYLMAKKFGNIILSCQQSTYPKWDKPIRGFFYEDSEHRNMLTYEHRGHEQNPIQGLIALCETFTDHEDYDKWISGIKLYREYVLSSYEYSTIYGLMPAHIYHLDKFNMERFTIFPFKLTKEEALEDLKQQAKMGIKIDNKVYLRRFPVAIQRRGYHATLLSKTKAVSLIANFLNDDNLKQIVINQLEWIMGKNPFSTSSMYGEGYNYHPLYVAYSPELVGALPVGFMTKKDHDLPYWPAHNNAVFKEIWGHTTGKYLFIFADILKYEK